MHPYNVTPEEYAAFYEEHFSDRGKFPRISELIGSQKQALVTPPIYKEEEQAIKIPAPIEAKPLDADNDSPEYIDFSPRERIPLQHEKEARLLGHFCNLVIRRLALCHSKVEEWKLIVEEYNNGTMAPELFKLRGERKERALRLWIDQYIKSNQDMFALLHKGKNINHKRKVTEIESNVLLSILLHPNQITIGSAINMLKAQARMGYFESPTSKPTLRRWCTEWMENHLATWEQTRKGSKYVAEHIVKTIHRDARLLRVGQVWVADGHTLAFDILNPHTGKAQRMTMIMVFDWASRYPVGASLAFTEDSQHIQTAFRNAFLNTSHWYLQTDAEGNTVQTRPPFAFVPEAVYLDNGKAFRAKLFHESWEGHDLELELGGVFPKLGIEAHFAESYNAKAKVIERFFRTFQEQFERFISSFRGANVANKPSTLMRNEKWAKALYKREAPTIQDAMQMIGFYIRHIYGETEHGGLEGKTPWQVFSSALVPEERMLRPDKLNFMMLATERKSVRNDGIVFNKLLYWHIALMDNIGKPVIIRYDYAEARWILVYDMKDNFICQAELRRSQHPFIHIDKNNPVSHQSLKKEYTQIKKLQRLTEQHARDFVLHNQEAVDNLLEPYVRESLSGPNPTFQQGGMITAPEPEVQDRIEAMEQEMVKELPALEFITPEAQNFGTNQPDPKIIDTDSDKQQETSTADPEPEEQDDDDDESFYGMLKKVGII